MSLFRILISPRCWMRNHQTNKALDEWMIEALKEPKFSNYGSFTIDLNGKTIWIKNYPYDCGQLHGKAHLGLPSRSTVFKLFDAISNYRTNKKRIHFQKILLHKSSKNESDKTNKIKHVCI